MYQLFNCQMEYWIKTQITWNPANSNWFSLPFRFQVIRVALYFYFDTCILS